MFSVAWGQNHQHIWSQRFGDASWQWSKSVAVDASGNVILTGWIQGTVDFGGGPLTSAGFKDIFVAKFDPNGNHVWSQRFGDASRQEGESVAVDSSGNVVVTGVFYGTVDFGGGPLTSAGYLDIFVAKFDPNGNHVWSQRFGDANDENHDQYGKSVAVDGSGNVILTGHFWGTVDFGGGPLTSAGDEDIFVAKFDGGGSHIWSQRFGDERYNQRGKSVAADGSGNVVVTGKFDGTVDFGGGPLTSAGYREIFVVKFDPSGNHLWSQRYGDASDDQYGESVAVDGSENVIVTGEFKGTADFGGGPLTSAGSRDIFIARFDGGGNHIWSKCYGDENDQHGISLAVYSSGNFILTGRFIGTVDFGGGPLTSAGDSYGSDIFVAKFDPSSNHLWSQRFGDANNDDAECVAVDGSGNVIVTGLFSGTVDFGGGPLTCPGGYDDMDIFVAKFGPIVSSVFPPEGSALPTLNQNTPNPFNPNTTISFTLPKMTRATLRIYNVAGRHIATLFDGVAIRGMSEHRWAGVDRNGKPVPSGVYFYRLYAENQVLTRKMVLLK
jgi:hypothetical protein